MRLAPLNKAFINISYFSPANRSLCPNCFRDHEPLLKKKTLLIHGLLRGMKATLLFNRKRHLSLYRGMVAQLLERAAPGIRFPLRPPAPYCLDRCRYKFDRQRQSLPTTVSPCRRSVRHLGDVKLHQTTWSHHSLAVWQTSNCQTSVLGPEIA